MFHCITEEPVMHIKKHVFLLTKVQLIASFCLKNFLVIFMPQIFPSCKIGGRELSYTDFNLV